MCGEIQEWQEAKTATVRLTTNGNQTVSFTHMFDQVEEIRLDEIMVTNFNGGVSGAAYLNLRLNGMHSGEASNERQEGLLILIDAANPHVIYQRPRLIGNANLVHVNSFQLSFDLPSGIAATFTEFCMVLTFVCRKSEDSISQIRRMKARMGPPPSVRDAIVANQFQN